MSLNLEDILKNKPLTVFNPVCIRTKSNWSKSNSIYKFDSDTFSPETLLNDMYERSPKLVEMLKNIEALNKSDMKRDGTHYKHFIFCDVKSGNQGARMLASALIAKGYNLGYNAKRIGGIPKEDSIKTGGGGDLNSNTHKVIKPKKRFNKLELSDLSELKKTSGKNFYLLSSIDVFDQSITVKHKAQLLLNFNSRPSNVYGKDVQIIIMDGGYKEGIDLFDIKYIHVFEPSVNVADQKQVIGRGTRTCGQKGLKFHPTQGWRLHVYIYDMDIPNQLHSSFLDSETTFELYAKSMNMDIRIAQFATDLEETNIIGSIDYELNREVHTFKVNNQEGGARKLVIRNDPPIIIDPTGKSTQITLPSGQMVSAFEPKPMNFKEMREYIRKRFSDHKWSNVKMENLCEDDKTKGGGKMEFTPTQRFIKSYFTPQCPVKGMLLWHSTGTGKTCSAIASATSSFDPQGYTILWVTRTTLKNDIWKNMFDQICNEQIRIMIADGITLPEEHSKRMRILSKAWRIRPISYRQFSNLVTKDNNYYKRLVDINGKDDPLRKTLLIIDEAHKLYGGNMSSMEQPDMKVFHNALMNSYAISGRDSVRLLLLTATPITEHPMEIVKLINLCKPIEDQIPSEFPTFATKFLSENGKFTPDGRNLYLDQIAGHISYLNRESDARQFAQPILHHITVPVVSDVSEMSKMDKRYLRYNSNRDVQDMKTRIEAENAKIESDLKDLDNTRFYALRDICDEYDGIAKKGCTKIANRQISQLVKEARSHSNYIKDNIKGIREEIKNKNIYRKETLKQMDDHLNANPEEFTQFKKGMYYTLKYECGKTINNNEKFNELSSEHPRISELTAELHAYDVQIEHFNNELQIFMDAHKKRSKELKIMLRTWDLSELERSVVKSTLKDEQKMFNRTKKERHSIVKIKQDNISKSKKKIDKRLNKTRKRLKKQFRTGIRNKKSADKDAMKVEKALRKTQRKQGTLREEFKDGILKDLMDKSEKEIHKYINEEKIAYDAKDKLKADEKETKDKLKADEKATKDKLKADEKTRKQHDKKAKELLRLTKKVRIKK